MLQFIKQLVQPTPPTVLLQQAQKVSLPTTPTPIVAKVKNTTKKEEETIQEEQLTRVAKLIMVTTSNNNKYYEMRANADDTFTVTYGRVGAKGTTRTYSISQWDTKYNEKVRKGYTDQTHLFARVKKETSTLAIDDKMVAEIVNDLMRYARQSIDYHYEVSAANVTRQQVEEAQLILDNLVNRVKLGMRARYFNDKLLELFQVIPRRMSRVNDHLIKTPKTDEDINAIRNLLVEEQATLDVMRGQVELNETEESETTPETTQQTLLDAMGIQMELLEDKTLIDQIKKMMGDDANKFKRAYKVVNLRTQRNFDAFIENTSNKKTTLFWHGSRNENWLSILKSGLVLRPASAVITGKMFGYGLYFADKFKKSLNYTSLWGSYWTGGNQKKAYLALYDVHVGNQLKIKQHKSWCYELNEQKLKARSTTTNYDSLFAKGGADLINNEYIVYNENQCTVRYIVEVQS